MKRHLQLIPLLALTLLSTSLFAAAADLERERRIAEQISDAILDGEPLELEAAGHPFLAIAMQSDAAEQKGAAIILHGRGLHPDWESVVRPLRTGLPARGWHTLSLQLPVLDKEAKYYDYVPLFAEAVPRIEAAIAYLRAQGVERIVIIAHSCGAHMAMHWFEQRGDGAINAYVGIGMGATDYQQPMKHPFPLARMKVPLLDLYGSDDYPAVLRMAPERLRMLEQAGNRQSAQQEIAGAEHYFSGKGDELLEVVAAWLNELEF